MQKILSNIRNNKGKILLCILITLIIELAPMIFFINIPGYDNFFAIALLFLFLFTYFKNFLFVLLYGLKDNFMYSILEKTLSNIKYRFILFGLFLLCDAFFIFIITRIARLNNHNTIEGVSYIYFGLLAIYILFLLGFSKKTNIPNSPIWTNVIFIAEKIFYFLIALAMILYTLLMLLVLFFISNLNF